MIPTMLEDSIPDPALLPGLCARLSSPARAHPGFMEIAWTKSSVEQCLSPTRKDRSCPCFKESRDGKRGVCLKTCYSTQFHGLSSFSPSIMGKNVDKPCKIGSVSQLASRLKSQDLPTRWRPTRWYLTKSIKTHQLYPISRWFSLENHGKPWGFSITACELTGTISTPLHLGWALHSWPGSESRSPVRGRTVVNH